MSSESNSIKICGLYKKTDSNGHVYLTGSLSEYVQLSAFQNAFKKEPSHPDYWLTIQAKKPKPSKQEVTDAGSDL